MAKYLILIYGPESDAAPTSEQWDWMMQAHGQFAQAVDQQGGKILGGEALRPRPPRPRSVTTARP